MAHSAIYIRHNVSVLCIHIYIYSTVSHTFKIDVIEIKIDVTEEIISALSQTL